MIAPQKYLIPIIAIIIISGCASNSGTSGDETIEDVFSMIKTKLDLDQNYYVKYSKQKLGNLVGYGQMEYTDNTNNKIAVLVLQCKSKKDIENCFNMAKEQALKNAKDRYGTAHNKDISAGNVKMNELIINNEIHGNGYYFFWKHDRKYIIQVGHISPTTSEGHVASVVKKITSLPIPVSHTKETTAEDDSATSDCPIGIFGFSMTNSVTPTKFTVKTDGTIRITLVNNIGKDVTIKVLNGQEVACNPDCVVSSGDEVEVTSNDAVDRGSKGECFRGKKIVIEYDSEIIMNSRSSGYIDGGYE